MRRQALRVIYEADAVDVASKTSDFSGYKAYLRGSVNAERRSRGDKTGKKAIWNIKLGDER